MLQMMPIALAEGFNERLLTPEEKRHFDDTKGQALQVWFDNQAWRPVPESEAKEGETVPTRFLQRSKPTKEGKKANASHFAGLSSQGRPREEAGNGKSNSFNDRKAWLVHFYCAKAMDTFSLQM